MELVKAVLKIRIGPRNERLGQFLLVSNEPALEQ